MSKQLLLAIGALFDNKEEIASELGVKTDVEITYKTDMRIIKVNDTDDSVILGHYYMQAGDCVDVRCWDKTVDSFTKKLPPSMKRRMHVALIEIFE